MNDLAWQMMIIFMAFVTVYLFVRYAWFDVRGMLHRQEMRYDAVLNHQLLLDVSPRIVLIVGWVVVFVIGAVLGLIGSSMIFFIIGAALAYFIPQAVLKHLQQKRRQQLDAQIVDAIGTLSSSVRAGLNMVQSFEVLEQNSSKPLNQEISQLLREYNMGLDLNQAMRNASRRIGSPNYRLLFTAIEMHRLRGGDAGESLDRIAESVREIQRLEGKLDAMTSQGRIQANMLAAMPFILLGICYFIVDPEAVEMLFVEPTGRLLLLGACTLIAIGFVWIRKIMQVDI